MWDFDQRRSIGNLLEVNVKLVKEILREDEKQNWATDFMQIPRLKTYCAYKVYMRQNHMFTGYIMEHMYLY